MYNFVFEENPIPKWNLWLIFIWGFVLAGPTLPYHFPRSIYYFNLWQNLDPLGVCDFWRLQFVKFCWQWTRGMLRQWAPYFSQPFVIWRQDSKKSKEKIYQKLHNWNQTLCCKFFIVNHVTSICHVNSPPPMQIPELIIHVSKFNL